MLNEIVDGRPPRFPFTEVLNPPHGYTWGDVSYVIGGYHWKARFIDKKGNIITGSRVQRNFANPVINKAGAWVPYKVGQEKPYDCGKCHTTGYQPSGLRNDRPWIVGTWAESGIGCESCHGPGS